MATTMDDVDDLPMRQRPRASIETNRGDMLSGFHESARDFCREACLAFTRDGVHLCGRDSAKVVLVQYTLPAKIIREDGQGKYSCDSDRIDVGIDTKIMASCLSSVACGDLVGFSVDMEKEPDRLIIRCQNKNSGKRSCYRVIIPEIADDLPNMTPIETYGYNAEICMSSMLFHDMLRDLTKSDSIDVRVCCDGSRLVLFANGRYIKAAFEVMIGTDPSRFRYEGRPGDRWPVCECFSINFLQKVAKAKGVAQDIHIYLQPNFPIAFAYETPLGSLSFMISPRNDAEWTENPDARTMPAPSDDICGIVPRQKSNGSKKRQPAATAAAAAAPNGRHIRTPPMADEEEEDDVTDDDERRKKVRKRCRSDDVTARSRGEGAACDSEDDSSSEGDEDDDVRCR
jgi:hypothetical protein